MEMGGGEEKKTLATDLKWESGERYKRWGNIDRRKR
jgi:hypothetical protein